MPIAAGVIPLKTQIATALKLDRAANPDLVSLLITTAISSIAPMGLFPPGPVPAPLVPGGFAGTNSQTKSAFSMGQAANPGIVAQQWATAISILCPTAPPTGLTVLKSQIETAFKLDKAANPDLVAQMIATAIVSYYTAGGVI